MKGIQFLLCTILTVLIIMAERGVPVKLEKYDWITYGIGFASAMFISNILN